MIVVPRPSSLGYHRPAPTGGRLRRNHLKCQVSATLSEPLMELRLQCIPRGRRSPARCAGRTLQDDRQAGERGGGERGSTDRPLARRIYGQVESQVRAPPYPGGQAHGTHCLLRDVRRTRPLTSWGEERGLPTDRWYIESDLSDHAHHLRGHVLEVKGDHYASRFGATAVDVVDIDASNADANVVGDLCEASTWNPIATTPRSSPRPCTWCPIHRQRPGISTAASKAEERCSSRCHVSAGSAARVIGGAELRRASNRS